LERHRSPLAYSYSHRNSYSHRSSFRNRNSFRSHGSFRNPCSCAIAFTKPISGTKAPSSFNGDRATTRCHAVPQSRAYPSGGLAGRRQPIALFF
jgi:hypothetical protein